jgi:hypothetical protein
MVSSLSHIDWINLQIISLIEAVSVRLIPIDEQDLSRHDKIVQMTAESR